MAAAGPWPRASVRRSERACPPRWPSWQQWQESCHSIGRLAPHAFEWLREAAGDVMNDSMSGQPCDPIAKLTCYSPGEQGPHEHTSDQLSLVLLGDAQERSVRWDVDISRPMIGFKPAGTRHSNRWGPDGALIFSISLGGDWKGSGRPQCGWWSPPALQRLRALVRGYFQETDVWQKPQYLWDFAALARNVDPVPSRRSATWLKKVREQLREDPEGTQISTLADGLGLHRVSLSRMFVHCYGVPPSLYRSRCKAMKAVAAAVTGDRPLSSAGQAGGFFDQSHASRTVKRETGLNMTDLRLFSQLH